MNWFRSRSASGLAALALVKSSSLLYLFFIIVVGRKWLDLGWLTMNVGQRGLHCFLPGVLDEGGIREVALVCEAVEYVLVVGNVQWRLAVDIGLAAVDGEPVSPVDAESPASECIRMEARTLVSWVMQRNWDMVENSQMRFG